MLWKVYKGIQKINYHCMLFSGGVEVPEFGEPITNLTIPISRDATFKCIVVNLGNYRVSKRIEKYESILLV